MDDIYIVRPERKLHLPVKVKPFGRIGCMILLIVCKIINVKNASQSLWCTLLSEMSSEYCL